MSAEVSAPTSSNGLSTRVDERGIVIRNPWSGEVLHEVRITDRASVDRAVTASRAAFEQWRRVPPGERGQVLHRVADAVAAVRHELASTATDEMGRPLAASAEGVDAAVSALRQCAELGPLRRGRALAGGWDALDVVLEEPRGVVAALTPWNDPVAVPAGILAAALVTGNTVVLKPSERSPVTGRLLAQVMASELPDDVVAHVGGDGSTGAALAQHHGVDVIVHVGSTDTGRRIRRATAESGAKAVLENGGSDALVIDAGVDPVWAGRQLSLGAFANAGQLCTAVERVYVVREIADAVIAAVLAESTSWVLGDPREPGTTLGPLVDQRMRDHVHGQVSAAVATGADLLCGGVVPDGPGSGYPVTVLTRCRDDMVVMAEETFGPVAAIMVVDDVDEGLRRASRSAYGLAATVLTDDHAVAQRAVRELDVGTVKINAVFGGAPGGSADPRRGSGSGMGYGPGLLDEVTVRKAVHLGPVGRA